MTLWQFTLSFLAGGAVAFAFATASGYRRIGLMREHPILASVFLVLTSVGWPYFAIRGVTRTEEQSHER